MKPDKKEISDFANFAVAFIIGLCLVGIVLGYFAIKSLI